MNENIIPLDRSALIGECLPVFEDAFEALSHAWNQTQDLDHRTRIGAFLNECDSFNEIKAMLIDPDTGLFVTTAARDTVIESLARIAVEAFGDRFPLLRYKALNLVVRLNDAGEQICLLDSELSNTSTLDTIH